jgi:molecular chaperone DnaJ
LALRFHPDRNPGDAQAEAQFKEVNEAYQILSDENKRAEYDLHSHLSEPNRVTWDFVRGPSRPRARGEKNIQDMMDEIFAGGDFAPFRTPRQAQTTQEVFRKDMPGDNILLDLELSLEESVTGCKKPVTIKAPRPNVKCESCHGIGSKPGTRRIVCTRCAGHGKINNGARVSTCTYCNGAGNMPLERCNVCGGNGKIVYEKEITVQVPAGVSAGQQLRLAGQGSPGHPPGDLYLTLKIIPSKLFWRDGQDLHTKKILSLRQAILGGGITFIGPDGAEVHVQIPAGSQPGDLVRIPSAGVLGVLSKTNGDLIIHLDVTLPKSLSNRGKKLLDEFIDELSRGPQKE